MRQSSYVIVTAIVIGFIGRVCVCALWKARMSPPNPKVLEGSPLEINCTLLDGVADTRFNSSDLFIEVFAKSNPNRSRRIPDNFYDRPNSRTLQMVIPEASSEDDDSSFICNLNRSAYGEKVERVGMLLDARIGRLPGDVNPSIVSRNLERLQLSWCTNQVGVSYSIRYTNDRNKPYVPKEVSQTTDRSSTTDRVCWRSEWEHESELCYIEIEGKNDFGSRIVYENDSLEPRSYVKLNQTALKPYSVGSRWIGVEWSVPVSEYSPPGAIQCRLTYSSTIGPTIEKLVVGKENIDNLTDLCPFTDYSVSMSCKPVDCSDCLWSDGSSIRVSTSEDVPSKSPILQSSFYRIKNCSDQSCNVKVFWKPVPENSRNGVIEKYLIDIYESNDVSDSQSLSLTKTVNLPSTTNGYEFAVNRTARVTVEVRAFTKAGESPSASIAIRPPKLSTPLIEDGSLFGERASKNRSQVVIGWKTATNVADRVVVYCFRDERENVRQRSDDSDVSPPCDAETLSTEYAPSNASNVTITLRSGLTLVYSVTAVLDDGNATTGLLTDWQHCIYDGGAMPAKPIFHDASCDVNGTTVTYHWTPPTCVERNAKAMWYTAVACPENGCNPLVEHRTDRLSPSIGYHVMNDLQPETYYRLQLFSISSTGIKEQPDVKFCRTGASGSSGAIPLVSLVVLLPVGLVSGLLYRHREKIKKLWYAKNKIVVPTRPTVWPPLLVPPNQSSSVNDGYELNVLSDQSSANDDYTRAAISPLLNTIIHGRERDGGADGESDEPAYERNILRVPSPRILPLIESSINCATSINSSEDSYNSSPAHPYSSSNSAECDLYTIVTPANRPSEVDSVRRQTVDDNNNVDDDGGETTTSSNPADDSPDSLAGSSPSISDDIEPYSHTTQADVPTLLIDISSDCSDEDNLDDVSSQVQQSGPPSSSSQPDDGYQAAKLKSVQNFPVLSNSPVDPVYPVWEMTKISPLLALLLRRHFRPLPRCRRSHECEMTVTVADAVLPVDCRRQKHCTNNDDR